MMLVDRRLPEQGHWHRAGIGADGRRIDHVAVTTDVFNGELGAPVRIDRMQRVIPGTNVHRVIDPDRGGG